MEVDQLPSIDEHATAIASDVDQAWRALVETLDESFSRSRAVAYARAVGCTDYKATGPRPLTDGSTIPGFRVVAANPGHELVLRGRHRFSDYALIFRLQPTGPGRFLLRAETRAAFPGVGGRAYRLLVIGTGGHVRMVRSMLKAVRRRAEQR